MSSPFLIQHEVTSRRAFRNLAKAFLRISSFAVISPSGQSWPQSAPDWLVSVWCHRTVCHCCWRDVQKKIKNTINCHHQGWDASIYWSVEHLNHKVCSASSLSWAQPCWLYYVTLGFVTTAIFMLGIRDLRHIREVGLWQVGETIVRTAFSTWNRQ